MSFQSVVSKRHQESVLGHVNLRDDALEQVQRAVTAGLHNKAHKLLVDARLIFPDCARVAYMLGISFLERGNMTGLEHLKYAMAQDETLTGAACNHAVSFLSARGVEEAAAGFQRKLDVWQANCESTDAEV